MPRHNRRTGIATLQQLRGFRQLKAALCGFGVAAQATVAKDRSDVFLEIDGLRFIRGSIQSASQEHADGSAQRHGSIPAASYQAGIRHLQMLRMIDSDRCLTTSSKS